MLALNAFRIVKTALTHTSFSNREKNMESNSANSRLAYLPIAFFAMVMGLSGLTIAWEKAQQTYQLDLGVTLPLLSIAASVFALLLIAYLLKSFKYSSAVTQEWKHPVKLSFFPTISISLLLLSVAFLEINHDVANILWLAGATLHLIFTLAVINMWMHHEHFQVQHMTPAWFIPAVGNVIVPIGGTALGYTEISWFFFSIGMLFWMVLLTLAFNRIIFHTPIDARLMPSLFILIAPPAVGFIAYMRLNHGDLDNFARILYFAGLFLTLLLFTQIGRFARLQFALSWWAYSFPLAAITIASFVMFDKTQVSAYLWIATGLLVILTAVVLMLFVKTLMAAIKGKICVLGH